MITKVILSPQRYVQGPGVLSAVSEHIGTLGIANPLVLADRNVIEVCRTVLGRGLESNGIGCRFEEFAGECTWSEVARVKAICLNGNHDAIISCGGGKTLDTGRAAASANAINAGVAPPQKMEGVGAGVPCVQVPTIASTDAPTARACLIYDDKGIFETVIIAPTNPAMVLVDTEIIARAPVRTLVAGMGDAMATYFEADTCHRTGAITHAGGLTSRTALTLARLAFDTLMEYGRKAKIENEAGVAGPALEAVVEANILLSGVGYESGGLSAAHAVAESLTILKDIFEFPSYHGEMVSFGTITHLLLEDRDPSLLEQVMEFYQSVGLPKTLKEIGLSTLSDEDLFRVADAASKDPLIRSMPGANRAPGEDGRFYDCDEILRCLKAADAYGRNFSREQGLQQ
jgi:glycerol dehydrogenase